MKRLVLSTPASLGYVVAESREDLLATLEELVQLMSAPEESEFRIDEAELPAYDPSWREVAFGTLEF